MTDLLFVEVQVLNLLMVPSQQKDGFVIKYR